MRGQRWSEIGKSIERACGELPEDFEINIHLENGMSTKEKQNHQKAPTQTITAYKGFDLDWKCRDFQYEVGKTYEHMGEVKACQSGFHACEHPLDVFRHYPPAGSRFALVEQSGIMDKGRDGDDSKIASQLINIKAEIDVAYLVKAAIEFTKSKCLPIDPSSPTSATGDRCAASAKGYNGAASATGERGAASAAGDRGAASATGDQGAASAVGYRCAASATGDRGAASAAGYYGVASATGYYGAASATGDQGAASATGYYGSASAAGDQGAASATGENGAASAAGYRGAASATGDQGAASATGDRGAASATGDVGVASATGYRGAASATGYYGAASATGDKAVACGLGYESRALASKTGAIVLVHRNDKDEIVHIRASKVGENGIKPDTWYTLDKDGQFVECEA